MEREKQLQQKYAELQATIKEIQEKQINVQMEQPEGAHITPQNNYQPTEAYSETTGIENTIVSEQSVENPNLISQESS